MRWPGKPIAARERTAGDPAVAGGYREAVMASSISGYTYRYHRQIDIRDLVRE